MVSLLALTLARKSQKMTLLNIRKTQNLSLVSQNVICLLVEPPTILLPVTSHNTDASQVKSLHPALQLEEKGKTI